VSPFSEFITDVFCSTCKCSVFREKKGNSIGTAVCENGYITQYIDILQVKVFILEGTIGIVDYIHVTTLYHVVALWNSQGYIF